MTKDFKPTLLFYDKKTNKKKTLQQISGKNYFLSGTFNDTNDIPKQISTCNTFMKGQFGLETS